jgi:hypothetical protein
MAKCTFFLAHGACQDSTCFDKLTPFLSHAGHDVVAGSLLSLNPPNPNEATAAKDGQELLDRYLLPLVEDGKDVVVYAHSYGSTCLSGAARGITKAERSAAGLPGGVVGCQYTSSFTFGKLPLMSLTDQWSIWRLQLCQTALLSWSLWVVSGQPSSALIRSVDNMICVGMSANSRYHSHHPASSSSPHRR